MEVHIPSLLEEIEKLEKKFDAAIRAGVNLGSKSKIANIYLNKAYRIALKIEKKSDLIKRKMEECN